MTDHTPGPWTLKYHLTEDGRRELWVETRDGAAICHFPTWLEEAGSRPKGNAVLASQAPSMYEALQDVQLGLYELHGSAAIFHPLFDKVDEALEQVAKAQMEGDKYAD